MKSLPVTEFLTLTEAYSPSESISKVIGVMKNSGSYEVFIEERETTAIVTVRDILKVRDITTTKLSTIMNYIPRLNRNNKVEDAASLMYENRIRSLPVYDNSKMIGQINTLSLIKKLMETEQDSKIGNLMTPNPITVESSDYVSKARTIMLRRKIDQVPILRNGKIQSVITSSDIVFNMVPQADGPAEGGWNRNRFDVPVGDYASEITVSNEIQDSLNTVLKNMTSNRASYSVILGVDEVQGIVTYRDFMRLLSHSREDDLSIPLYMIGLPSDPFQAEASREKFKRIVRFLLKAFPDITEARAIIKGSQTKAAKTRYEVQIHISLPDRRLSYNAFGFELPEIFDSVSLWSKKLAAKSGKGKSSNAHGKAWAPVG